LVEGKLGQGLFTVVDGFHDLDAKIGQHRFHGGAHLCQIFDDQHFLLVVGNEIQSHG